MPISTATEIPNRSITWPAVGKQQPDHKFLEREMQTKPHCGKWEDIIKILTEINKTKTEEQYIQSLEQRVGYLKK